MTTAPRLSKDKSVHVTDEVFNASSHMIGAVFALLGWIVLIVESGQEHKPWHVVSFAIYGCALFLLFLFSTLHHGINASEPIEAVLRRLDYFGVFALIAGSFTPICLVLVRTAWTWCLLGVVWGLAITGIVLTAALKLPRWVTNGLYISMGWLGVLLAMPLHHLASPLGLLLFYSGGLFYTAGFVIYTIERPNPIPGRFGFHEIWHVLVLLGALCHYLFMYLVVLPAPG